jgi:hypothetical protein
VNTTLAIVRRGVLAGVLGSLIVATLQGVADLILERMLFHTPGVLGLGMVGMPGVVASNGDIVRFTALHVAVFVVIGLVLAAASHRAVAGRAYRWLIAAVFLAVFFGSATMAEAWDPYHLALPTWMIVAWNVVALAAMGWFLGPRSNRSA